MGVHLDVPRRSHRTAPAALCGCPEAHRSEHFTETIFDSLWSPQSLNKHQFDSQDMPGPVLSPVSIVVRVKNLLEFLS